MHADVPIASCTSCFKPLRQGARPRYCKECRAKLRLRLMFEAATKHSQEVRRSSLLPTAHNRSSMWRYYQPQPPWQSRTLTTCGVCGGAVQLPPYPVDPQQVIVCAHCRNASFNKQQLRQSGQWHAAPVQPAPPTPSTPHTPQQGTPEEGDGQLQHVMELDDASFTRYIASEAMNCVHPAHATADLCGLAADFVRIAPEGRTLAPASMLPVPHRPSLDGRLYSERGDIQVPVITWRVPMPIPLPPPPSATPDAHRFYLKYVAPPSPVLKPSHPPAQEATVPIRSKPHAPRAPPTQHRGSIGSNTAIPNIRRSLPASAVLPPQLIRQSPTQPVMLQHFHAAVPPPVHPSDNVRVQGWVQPRDRPAASKVRLCETSGCNRVLSPGHAWRICSHCLAARTPKQPGSDRAVATSTNGKVRGQDIAASATPSVASGSHQQNRPHLHVTTEPSHQHSPKEDMHHVLPLPPSAVSVFRQQFV